MTDEQRTLKNLVVRGESLVFHCKNCKQFTMLDLDQLVRQHGAKTRVSFVQRVTQCLYCGGHKTEGQS